MSIGGNLGSISGCYGVAGCDMKCKWLCRNVPCAMIDYGRLWVAHTDCFNLPSCIADDSDVSIGVFHLYTGLGQRGVLTWK